MKELKNYLSNLTLGVVLGGIYTIIWFKISVFFWCMLGWLLGDLAMIPVFMRNFSFRNYNSDFYFLSYDWKNSNINLIISLDLPSSVVTEGDSLVHTFKYADAELMNTPYLCFRFLWFYVTYMEVDTCNFFHS